MRKSSLLLALALLLAGCAVTLVPAAAPAPVTGVTPGDWFTEAAAWALMAGRHTPGQIVDVWRQHRPHLLGD